MKKLIFLVAATFAQPALAIDECLIGVWLAEASDLAETLGAQLNATAEYADGEVFMQINDAGDVDIFVSNITMIVDKQGVPEMEVTVTGFSRATMTAEAGNWLLVGSEYALTGSAFVMGQSMSIPFSSDTGMLGGGSGAYTCDADNISFESTGEVARIPHHWTRSPG